MQVFFPITLYPLLAAYQDYQCVFYGFLKRFEKSTIQQILGSFKKIFKIKGNHVKTFPDKKMSLRRAELLKVV